jgi:hypothetical protein
MLYDFFCVIPRRLKFICWRFGTDCSETSAYKLQVPGELPERKHTITNKFVSLTIIISKQLIIIKSIFFFCYWNCHFLKHKYDSYYFFKRLTDLPPVHFNALHLNDLHYAVLFENFNTLIASTIGIITGSVYTSTYSIHHFTCDITKIFQFSLPSLCILFHPSLAPPFSSSIAHYTIPRNLKTLLHITLHHEFYRHSYTLCNTPRALKTVLHLVQYTTISQDTLAHYKIQHELSRHCCTLCNTPRALKTLQHIIQYTTSSQDTPAHYTIHHELSRRCCIL